MKNSFNPVDPRTLRQSVTEAIRRGILEGDLLPGDQINQVRLAEQLGVSRGPVREALGQLEEEGLIKNVPYKGIYVTEINGDYIGELYSIRHVIEIFAIRRAVLLVSEEDLKDLRTVVNEMYVTAERYDISRMGTLDIQFHYLICRSAHHNLLLQIWKSIEIGVRRCMTLRHRIYTSPADVIGTHPNILAALEARDADQAASILGTHIIEAGDRLYDSWVRSQAKATALVESNGSGVSSEEIQTITQTE